MIMSTNVAVSGRLTNPSDVEWSEYLWCNITTSGSVYSSSRRVAIQINNLSSSSRMSYQRSPSVAAYKYRFTFLHLKTTFVSFTFFTVSERTGKLDLKKIGKRRHLVCFQTGIVRNNLEPERNWMRLRVKFDMNCSFNELFWFSATPGRVVHFNDNHCQRCNIYIVLLTQRSTRLVFVCANVQSEKRHARIKLSFFTTELIHGDMMDNLF